ncbi:APC family permease [Antarcticibacterium sp. 1MA-6-2]|uniref:APC family permease n=1 Tax=Antarcticibacterium sp. 1MA-6-2 TaxID=2908210 RepID=UPI001F35D61A|nr:APC family permease [Antarcticibacterium sp. 1MA-6-2]UJH93040.1 APC family permease [Antarcticibacterium sp. 1MA-6-2]
MNPAFGFSAGWMFLISKLSAAGVVAIGLGSYFYQLVPVASPLVLSIFVLIFLTIANLLGIKKAGTLNIVIVAFTLLSLFYLIISGIPNIQPQNFEPFAPFGISGIAEAAALLFFAFTGYARIATLAEEVLEPKKTIPKAIIITIVTAIILYAAVSVVAVGVIGVEKMANSTSPLQLVAEALTTPGIKVITTIGASTAMLGVLLSQILGISRMMLAMGRRKDLPPFLNNVHSKYRIPHTAIFLTGAVILALTLRGNFEFIVRSASFTILLYYSITNFAALKQPRKERLYGRIIPFCGLAGCLILSVSLPFNVILMGIELLATGFVFRALLHKSLR